MASSDSFFYRWVQQFVDSQTFDYLFVGHLSKKESREYWEKELCKDKKFEGSKKPTNFAVAVCTCYMVHIICIIIVREILSLLE